MNKQTIYSIVDQFSANCPVRIRLSNRTDIDCEIREIKLDIQSEYLVIDRPRAGSGEYHVSLFMDFSNVVAIQVKHKDIDDADL